MLYVIALSWLLVAAVGLDDWYLHACQAVLLVVPLVFFALQCLRDSGAPALRRARLLAQQLARRADWPAGLDACRLLPEVKALREALHVDAAPALELLSHARPQVRIAALAALEFRQNWQAGQAEVVLNAARRALEPEIRAAAVYALANRDDREIIEGLAEFLYDPSHGVRQAATEALLWNTEHRWPWIRVAVRRCLSDPAAQDDGAAAARGPAADRRGGFRPDGLGRREGEPGRAGGPDAGRALRPGVGGGARRQADRPAGPAADRFSTPRPCCGWSWPGCCTSTTNWMTTCCGSYWFRRPRRRCGCWPRRR